MGKRRENRSDEVLEYVEQYFDDNGYPPTYEEIRQALGLSSKSHVDYYLDALEQEGAIERTPRTPRGLRLTGHAPSTFEVQVQGRVAAGEPIEITEGPVEQIELTPDIADPRRDLYALHVEGDSMLEDLVADGDILIVEPKCEAAHGQMAVVHLKDRNAATLKHVYPEGGQVRLQPAHPTMPPLYVNAQDVQVQGQVVAIIRRY